MADKFPLPFPPFSSGESGQAIGALPNGTVGWTSSIGGTGEPGPQGPTGSTGPQGAQGAQGSQGFQGNQGVQGPQGPVGSPGTGVGATGPTGAQGPQGAQGATDDIFPFNPVSSGLLVGPVMFSHSVGDTGKAIRWYSHGFEEIQKEAALATTIRAEITGVSLTTISGDVRDVTVSGSLTSFIKASVFIGVGRDP